MQTSCTNPLSLQMRSVFVVYYPFQISCHLLPVTEFIPKPFSLAQTKFLLALVVMKLFAFGIRRSLKRRKRIEVNFFFYLFKVLRSNRQHYILCFFFKKQMTTTNR